MDGFLGFKCGPSCSEKQHNKEIKALIDAIDDLLAYDLETKKELGAEEPVMVDARRRPFTDKLDGIKSMVGSLLGTHIPEPFWVRSVRPRSVGCDTALQRLSATVDSAKSRIRIGDADPQYGWLTEKDMNDFQSHRRDLVFIHRFLPEGFLPEGLY
jgi:hypothetical protein